MSYRIEVYKDVQEKYISKLTSDEKSHLLEVIQLCLGEYLKKVSKRCNKKSLKGSNPKTYRLHVSMRHTVFYQIDETRKVVSIIKILGINQAHSKYALFSLF